MTPVLVDRPSCILCSYISHSFFPAGFLLHLLQTEFKNFLKIDWILSFYDYKCPVRHKSNNRRDTWKYLLIPGYISVEARGLTKYYSRFTKLINRYKKESHCGINLVVISRRQSPLKQNTYLHLLFRYFMYIR